MLNACSRFFCYKKALELLCTLTACFSCVPYFVGGGLSAQVKEAQIYHQYFMCARWFLKWKRPLFGGSMGVPFIPDQRPRPTPNPGVQGGWVPPPASARLVCAQMEVIVFCPGFSFLREPLSGQETNIPGTGKYNNKRLKMRCAEGAPTTPTHRRKAYFQCFMCLH